MSWRVRRELDLLPQVANMDTQGLYVGRAAVPSFAQQMTMCEHLAGV